LKRGFGVAVWAALSASTANDGDNRSMCRDPAFARPQSEPINIIAIALRGAEPTKAR